MATLVHVSSPVKNPSHRRVFDIEYAEAELPNGLKIVGMQLEKAGPERIIMIQSPRTSPRSEYMQQENLRVQQSPTLKEKFPKLKMLTVELSHYDPTGVSRSSQVKQTVNVAFAKSVFRVACHNQECVRGDFDLSPKLGAAVAKKKPSIVGEMCCQGWRNRQTIDIEPCNNILRYKLTLGY